MAKVKKMAFGGTSRNMPNLSGGLQMRQNKANAGITARPSYNPTPGTSPLPSKKLPPLGGAAGPIAGVPAGGPQKPGFMANMARTLSGMGGTPGPIRKDSGFRDTAMKKGGMTASKRADGCAQRGKTRGKMV